MQEPWDLLLDRYLAGECTPSEAIAVKRQLAESPELRATVEALLAARHRAAQRSADLPPATIGSDQVRAALARVEGRLAVRRRRRPEQVWAIAAALLVTAAGALVAARSEWVQSRQSLRVLSSAPARQRSVTLPDGTQLVLAPGAALRVPPDFGESNRTVELDGEALFTVVHDERHPFTVRAAGMIARDVGTRFDLASYPRAHVSRLAVLEGEVAVRASRVWWATPTHVHPGMVATIEGSNPVNVSTDANLASLTAWTTDQLEFDGAPLPVVIETLERWYGITIRLADPELASHHVTARVRPDALRGVLEALARPLGAAVDSTGGTWTLTLHRSNP